MTVTLRATKQGQDEGFDAQAVVLAFLQRNAVTGWIRNDTNGDWMLEKIQGDLVNPLRGFSMEVQTSEKPSENIGWRRSKHIHSCARDQCFYYRIPDRYSTAIRLLPLVIATDRLRNRLGNDLQWREYERDADILIWHQVLQDWGAVDLLTYCHFHGLSF